MKRAVGALRHLWADVTGVVTSDGTDHPRWRKPPYFEPRSKGKIARRFDHYRVLAVAFEEVPSPREKIGVV